MTPALGKNAWSTVQVLALFGLLVVLLLREIADPDIWGYLVVGREMASTLAIPPREFYLFPAVGEPAMFSALGYSLLHYGAYTLAGYPGMAVVNALLVAGALTVLTSVAGRRKASALEWPVLVWVLAGAYACLHFRTFYRPESTLYLFLALEICLLERWLDDGNARRLLWLPVLSWGIAQMHTTAILLVLVYGAYVCHWALEADWTPVSSSARRAALLIGVGAAMLALPILNPNGIEQVLLLVRTAREQNEIVEYLPIWSTPYRWHFVGLAFVAATAWLLSPERRYVDGLLLMGFGWLAFRYNRNLGLFALVAIVPVGRSLVHHAAAAYAAIAPWSRRWIAGGVMALGVAALVGVTSHGGGWGIGIRPGVFTEEAVELIRRVSARGNVMNFYSLGGHLAWARGPRYRLAVDGHFVRPSFALDYHDRVMRADPDWEALLARFDVGVVVTPATLPFSGALIPLVERLAEDPRWRLVNFEDAGLMFVTEELGAGLPAIDKRAVWRQVQAQATAVLASYPDHQGARDALLAAGRHLWMQRQDGPVAPTPQSP
jgi:hypothetical protein